MCKMTIEQVKKLARACTAVRLAIKRRVALKEIRRILAGDPKMAAANLGLTVIYKDGKINHDLDDELVLWRLVDCISYGRTKADTLQVLKDLRDLCHQDIDRAKA